MILKKSVEKVKGPIIPLLILLIPIFGITRMRFIRSCIIGWCIFFMYLIGMGITRQLVPNPKAFDSYTDISYQTINYGISIIGGMVSQYRQELLRRRNFCLQLPFSGAMDSHAVEDIKTEKFSTHALMHHWSLKFRNPEVEETFYRYWYLIDPFPYENPNAGSLHQGVFRTIRFAIYTTFLNQFVLLLQDIKFLKINKSKDPLVNPSDFNYAMVLRFGVTVPLYMSSAVFMYLVGRKFYTRWVQEAEHARNTALAQAEQVMEMHPVSNRSYDDGDGLRLPLVVEVTVLHEKTKEHLYDVLLNKGGYVRSTQIFSSLVIASHVACMGIILLAVSTGVNTTDGKVGKPKPVYYMGFLNAVLFAHRSGFRVRFIYATYSTCFVAIGIVIAAHLLSPTSDYYLEYAGFVCVIFLLGMMISYEEENLRRRFFVLKSIRTLEFEEWFSIVLRVQGWIRDRVRKKLLEVRSKRTLEITTPKEEEPSKVLTTSAQMAQASKIGMYSQLMNMIIAIVDLMTSI